MTEAPALCLKYMACVRELLLISQLSSGGFTENKRSSKEAKLRNHESLVLDIEGPVLHT